MSSTPASARVLGLALLWVMGSLLLPAAVQAQDLRGRATTAFRYVQLQPIEQDTVSRQRVTEGPDGRLTFEGRPVICAPGLGCTLYRIRPEQGSLSATQDVSLIAWGLGAQGLSATALLRARVRFDGELVWPRSDDSFDALLAYAELRRSELRLRAGRQETLSGLGFAGFDGASARWTPLGWFAVEGYAGRSLTRGLDEPQHDALRGIEDFIPDQNAYLFGAFASATGAAGSVGGRYQREIWSDRSGLVQERASLDVSTGYFRPVRLDAALDWDVALGKLGKSHLTAAYPVGASGLFLEGTIRRYVPYFQLSTIWGFFSPVPYHEALLRASFPPMRAISSQVAIGWRRYGDPERSDFLTPLTGSGWRAEASVAATPAPAWTTEASYRIEWGPGAFLNAVDGAVRWRSGAGIDLGATGTAFQQILEFRVGEGRVWGGGLSVGVNLPWRARLDGGAALYRHGPRNRATETPWNQARAWTTLSIGFGEDPGLLPDRRLRR